MTYTGEKKRKTAGALSRRTGSTKPGTAKAARCEGRATEIQTGAVCAIARLIVDKGLSGVWPITFAMDGQALATDASFFAVDIAGRLALMDEQRFDVGEKLGGIPVSDRQLNQADESTVFEYTQLLLDEVPK